MRGVAGRLAGTEIRALGGRDFRITPESWRYADRPGPSNHKLDSYLSSRRQTLKYLEAKQAFIDGLSRDVDAHEAGRYEEVGAGFDDLEAALPRKHGPEF